MPMPCPKQHLLDLRPQALLKLPILGRCAAPDQPPAPTFNNNMPEEIHLAPNAPRSRDASPKSKEPWCAWCTENGRTHNHTTANCSMLRNANANDQWKVINKHKVCDSCLVQGHYWRHCPKKIQECCTECGNSHHPNLQCINLKQASTYPGAG